MRVTTLPFSRPTIEQDEIDAVEAVLRSGWLTTGARCAELETAFCERLGAPHAISVSSATAGLHLALVALDLGPEDEVIVPSLTWATTANVVELLGARTVFADVERDSLNLDPADVARRMTERTRAVVPVHFAGQPVDLDALRPLTRDRGISLVEDAAHALGTSYKGREIGSTGELAVFSFHPIKNVTTGEGGIAIVHDESLAERIRLLRFHGVSKNAWARYETGGTPQYDVLEPGLKHNLTDIQAALGICQLRKLDRFNARRRELAERYDKLLLEIPELEPLARVPYSHGHAWHLYVVRLNLEEVEFDRNAFMLALGERGIGTGLHFLPLHETTWYRRKYGLASGSLPNTEYNGERMLSLPLYPLLTEEDQDDVLEAIRQVLRRHRRRR